MSRLTDAVEWSGAGATFCLFVILPAGASGALEAADPDAHIRKWHLEDVDDRLGGRECYEYDLSLDSVPRDVERFVRRWLRAALLAGAELAWFAFEGSFDFGHVLTADVAEQVFAVGTPAGVRLAVDDETRGSVEWTALLAKTRTRVGL